LKKNSTAKNHQKNLTKKIIKLILIFY
jgi:hypothetical protein